jgi:hypothetical protein
VAVGFGADIFVPDRMVFTLVVPRYRPRAGQRVVDRRDFGVKEVAVGLVEVDPFLDVARGPPGASCFSSTMPAGTGPKTWRADTENISAPAASVPGADLLAPTRGERHLIVGRAAS